MENKKIDHDDKLPIKFLISNFLFLIFYFLFMFSHQIYLIFIIKSGCKLFATGQLFPAVSKTDF